MKKPNKVIPAVKEPKIPLAQIPDELAKCESQMIELQLEMEKIEATVAPRVRGLIDSAVPALQSKILSVSGYHATHIEERLWEKFYEFLNAAPAWECRFVSGAMRDRQEVEALYRQGWRYLGSAFDAKAKIGGTMYHRPKVPDTLEEFKALYENMHVKKLPDSLKKREQYYIDLAKKAPKSDYEEETAEALPVGEETDHETKVKDEKPAEPVVTKITPIGAKKKLVKITAKPKR